MSFRNASARNEITSEVRGKMSEDNIHERERHARTYGKQECEKEEEVFL